MHAQSDNPTRDVIVSRKLPYYNIENSQYTILQIKVLLILSSSSL
jgi:hypothetical protein